jgi:hypothetical protein
MQDWLSPLTPPKAACHPNFHESGLCDVQHTVCQARVVLIESFGSLRHSNGYLHWKNGCVVNLVRLHASEIDQEDFGDIKFFIASKA